MKIWVSSLEKVHSTAVEAKPAHLVSLLSPGDIFPEVEGLVHANHHKVHLHDIREEKPGLTAPGHQHVEGIVEFLASWDSDLPLLVHCWAGISRSTATAFIAACLHNSDAAEADIAQAIAEASPTAFPNTRLVSIADDIMQRNGRMTQAAQAICQDNERMARVSASLEARPFNIPSRFAAAR